MVSFEDSRVDIRLSKDQEDLKNLIQLLTGSFII